MQPTDFLTVAVNSRDRISGSTNDYRVVLQQHILRGTNRCTIRLTGLFSRYSDVRLRWGMIEGKCTRRGIYENYATVATAHVGGRYNEGYFTVTDPTQEMDVQMPDYGGESFPALGEYAFVIFMERIL